MDNIKVVNAQGTKIFVAPVPVPPWADCAIAVTALKSSPTITCPQSIGALEETRQIQEYKCVSSNDSAKATGAVGRASFDVEVLFDPADQAGQLALQKAFRDNTQVVMGIEFGDTMIYFNAAVSARGTTIVQDSAVTTVFTLEISSDIKECSTGALITYAVINNGIIVSNNGTIVVNTH